RMAKELRLGIAGLGVASNAIIPAVVEHTNVELAAGADVRENALAQFRAEYGAKTFASVEAMCASGDVDAVYVCTPNRFHCENVISAAEHGKHVIVEKPMALTLDECERMNAAAEKNGVLLLCGHSKAFDVPIRKMREIVVGGELGKLGMINTWNYNEFMFRPRMPQELDPAQGGNVVYNQGPHQVDIVRLIGGGMVRSVRAMTGVWDASRRAEGAWAAYVEFEDGTPATLVYNGYAHFDTCEFTAWIGEGGQRRHPDTNLRARAAIRSAADETALKESRRYGGSGEWARQAHGESGERDHGQRTFGLTIVSCAHGDVRQSPEGLFVYADDAKR